MPARILCLLALLLAASGATAQQPHYPLVEVRTNLGAFVVELDTRRAPLTVQNFLDYADSGHYEGTIFHRVIAGFMIQGGGYDEAFDEPDTGEPIPNESGNGLSNRRGTIAMARTANPHSATAQFYVNLVDNPSLDPNQARWGYAVFGTVVEGMDVVDEIGGLSTGSGGPFDRDVPREAVVIERVQLVDADR